jgi:hypothetical protein
MGVHVVMDAEDPMFLATGKEWTFFQTLKSSLAGKTNKRDSSPRKNAHRSASSAILQKISSSTVGSPVKARYSGKHEEEPKF